MARILAIDTSGRRGSVALLDGERSVAERSGDSHGDHAARLLAWVEESFAEAGWSRASVDLYVGVRGPGSFTGIRIGLGLLTGLAMGADRPCVGVSGLAAAARAARERGVAGEVVVAFAAGRGELYVEGYELSEAGLGEVWLPASAMAESDVAAVAADRAATVLLRPGAGPELERLRAHAPCDIAALDDALAAPAGRLASAAGRSQAAEIAPLYLRPPDAIVRPRGAG